MKIIRNSIFYLLCVVVMGLVAACGDDDEAPCADFVCLNGGTLQVNGGDCACDCPAGFTGANCETMIQCVDVSCPAGQTANPANDCNCE